jgi:hypothetical protein
MIHGLMIHGFFNPLNIATGGGDLKYHTKDHPVVKAVNASTPNTKSELICNPCKFPITNPIRIS